MKILYFDCFNGVSLNLIFSAFLDAGITKEYIKEKMINYSFDILAEKKEDDIIPCVKADILVNEDKTITSENAIELAQSILDDTERCFVIMALKKLKKLKFSDYLKLYACVISYLSIDVNYALSSYLLDGTLDENEEETTRSDVLDIIRKDNIPYKVSSENGQLLFADGVSVISTLTKEYGPLPALDIIKIAYGTDGKNFIRIVIGTLKRKNVADFFEMSLDFKEDIASAFICGENK